MTKKQHYMTRDERQQLEAMRRNHIPVAEIARQLGNTAYQICQSFFGISLRE